MKQLAIVICGNGKPNKFISPIKGYTIVSEEMKRHFISKNPVIYEEMDGTQHCADLSEIVFADIAKAIGNIGNSYKVPNEYIEAV